MRLTLLCSALLVFTLSAMSIVSAQNPLTQGPESSDPLYLPPGEFGKVTLSVTQSDIQEENIFGHIPDFEAVAESPEVYQTISRPVGRLDMLVEKDGRHSAAYCTASLITLSHVITNNHCIPGKANVKVIAAKLRMNYLSDRSPGQAFEVNITPVETNSTLDYSILEVTDLMIDGKRTTPGELYGTVNLRTSREPFPLENLHVFHHPQGTSKKVTRERCYIPRRTDSITLIELKHLCDTQSGSSGGLIFSADGSLVGLHYGGFTPDTEINDRYNAAKKITAVIEQSQFMRELLGVSTGAEQAGQLSIDSDLGAFVELDGKFIGITPVEREVPAGVHTITVSHEAYDSVSQQIEVQAGQMAEVMIPIIQSAYSQQFASAPSDNGMVTQSAIEDAPDTGMSSDQFDLGSTEASRDDSSEADLGSGATVATSRSAPAWGVLASGDYASAPGLTFQIATTPSELETLWQQAHSNQNPPPPTPFIDFSRESVMAVFLGMKYTSGYGMEVRKVQLLPGKVHIDLQQLEPSGRRIGTQTISSPWMFLRVARPNVQEAYIYDATTQKLIGMTAN